MPDDQDPFRHHPALRDKIVDPDSSFFRTTSLADLDEKVWSAGGPRIWRHSDAEIAASHQRFLDSREPGDLWVLGYGSLMWDPAIRFREVRRARVKGYHRGFCLHDTLGGRGTPEAPGLMVALDLGGACDGLAFRIAADEVAGETDFLWRRERLLPAYLETMLEAVTAQGPIRVLAFVADHAAAMIRPDLSRAEQVRFIATGTGFLGSSLQYLENLVDHFQTLKIEDPELDALLAEARAHGGASAGS